MASVMISSRAGAVCRPGAVAPRTAAARRLRRAPSALHTVRRTAASAGEGEDAKPAPSEEKELETWQKSWVRQNPGRPLSEMPAEEPKFNPDNFDALSVLTGGVSLLVLIATLWLANAASELRNLSPEEFAARFGDDVVQDAGALPSSAPTAAPTVSDN